MSSERNGFRIFTCNGNPELAKRICAYLDMPLGDAFVGRFPDGEINIKLNEDVRGRDIFIVQPTCPPVNDNLMELLIMVDAARRSSARRITAVIPYYGYARQDRKAQGRVPISAKLVANLLVQAGVSRVLALDLHATQIQGFFDIPLDHLFSFPVMCRHFKANPIPNLVIATPDVGGIRMARAFAGELNAGLAVVDKRRLSPNETEPTGLIIGEVEGRNILLVDDLLTTGSSLAGAAQTLKDRGAKNIYAAVAHAVFAHPAAEKIAASPIEEVVVTDSIPLNSKARELGDRMKVLSVSDLLGEAMRRIHENMSVSSLFMKNE